MPTSTQLWCLLTPYCMFYPWASTAWLCWLLAFRIIIIFMPLLEENRREGETMARTVLINIWIYTVPKRGLLETSFRLREKRTFKQSQRGSGNGWLSVCGAVRSDRIYNIYISLIWTLLGFCFYLFMTFLKCPCSFLAAKGHRCAEIAKLESLFTQMHAECF